MIPHTVVKLLFGLAVVFSEGFVLSLEVAKAERISNQSRRDDCVDPNPDNTLTDRMNIALNSSGPGYVLSLCPSTDYVILAPINFAFPDQEISTLGYPTGDERATLIVFGPVANGTGHTTAVNGQCASCSGVKLRNVQINGTRNGAPPLNGGGNIEMGGPNSGQVVEYVHSFDPRGWTCLHIFEGPLNCTNVTVQNNDIGPCGSDKFGQWADGISFSCRDGVVRNNLINNPTDGGIVLFGSPGTLVENNTIWVESNTLLGGINMVDYEPFLGNFTDVIVQNNIIAGGFATSKPSSSNETKGDDQYDVIVKIGIAIGPRTWFGNTYKLNVSSSGTVQNNMLTGAFGYGIAITSARNFTVQDNVLVGNTSFIGSRGPNCTSADATPSSDPFVIDESTVESSSIQLDFENVPNANTLTCVVPPSAGDLWPFGGNPAAGPNSSVPSVGVPEPPVGANHSQTGLIVGLVVGLVGGVLLLALAAYYIRSWAIRRFYRRAGYKTRRGQKGSDYY